MVGRERSKRHIWPGTPLVDQVSDVADTRAREEQFPMAFSMAGRGASAPQSNVTPLIDVLLTLIIMFMLVVSMDPEYGEKAQIPEPNQKQADNQPQPRTVVIQVIWSGKDQAPTMKLNQEDVTWEELET